MAELKEGESGMKMRHFDFAGVSLIVPGNLDARVKPIPINLPPKSRNFTLIEVIANVVIFDPNNPNQALQGLRPPIEFYVHYTSAHVLRAGGNPSNLKLAYLANNQWVVFNNFTIFLPYTGQIGIARIDHWPVDPPIAIGG